MGWWHWWRVLAAAVLALAALHTLARPRAMHAEQDTLRGALQAALFRYEGWVQTQSDHTYGWRRDYVWPMSLYYLGEMYHGLYRLTGDPRYRAEMLRAADVALRAGPDALWFSYRGHEQYAPTPAAILNALFVELFLDATAISGQPRYAAHADAAVDQLQRTFFAQPLDGEDQPQDYYMLNFYAVAQYLSRTQRDDPRLRTLGQRLYERAVATLDRSTARWYYDQREQRLGLYDGHAAYYQSVSALFFLRNAAHVRTVFPSLHRELAALLPRLIDVALDAVQPNGTYYYAESVREYTESAAQVIWLADMDQQLFRTDRRSLMRRAAQTLLERQVWEGAFYSNELYHGPDIAYSDNIGWALAHWLRREPPDVRPAAAPIHVPLAAQPR